MTGLWLFPSKTGTKGDGEIDFVTVTPQSKKTETVSEFSTRMTHCKASSRSMVPEDVNAIKAGHVLRCSLSQAKHQPS